MDLHTEECATFCASTRDVSKKMLSIVSAMWLSHRLQGILIHTSFTHDKQWSFEHTPDRRNFSMTGYRTVSVPDVFICLIYIGISHTFKHWYESMNIYFYLIHRYIILVIATPISM